MKKKISNFNVLSKLAIVIGLIFVIYGILSRTFELYFFWESNYVGIDLILIGFIIMLSEQIKIKTKSTIEKIVRAILGFIIIFQILFLIYIPTTDYYKEAKLYLTNNKEIINEIGTIEGISISPNYNSKSKKNPEGNYKTITMNLILKGTKKYKEIKLNLTKLSDDKNWTIKSTEY